MSPVEEDARLAMARKLDKVRQYCIAKGGLGKGEAKKMLAKVRRIRKSKLL